MLYQTYRLILSRAVQSYGVSPVRLVPADRSSNSGEAIDGGYLVEGGADGIRTLSERGESSVALVN